MGRVRLDLSPDVLHVRVDGTLVRFECDAVDRVEELGPGEHATGLPSHGGEKLELGRRELGPPAGDGHAHAGQIELHVANPDQLGRGARHLRAPQHGTNAGDELLGAERLGDVVVSPEFQADELVRLVRPRGEHDDQHRRVTAQCACHVETVEARQPQIQDHEIRTLGPGDAQGRRPVRGGRNGEPGTLQEVSRQAHDMRLVVDDQDALHVGHRSLRKGDDRGRGRSPTLGPSMTGARSAFDRSAAHRPQLDA